jgi:hypothetical protein
LVFLEDFPRRPLAQSAPGLIPEALFIGPGDLGLEIALYATTARPTAGVLQAAWKARRGSRAAPVLVVALHDARAWLCGPTGESLPVHAEKDMGAIERLCATALRQPNRHAALVFLAQSLPSFDTSVPGVRNEGLFALHELTNDVPERPTWNDHVSRARGMIGSTGRELLTRLGYRIETLDNLTLLLRGAQRRTALAVLLDQTEVPEAGTQRFKNVSPVSYALAKADAENLDWVMVIQSDRLRLYPTKVGIGVGRRGRTETYVELQTSVLADAHLGYLPLLFSAESLQPGGTVQRLLEDSKRFASGLATGLRERIYDSVVPLLARAVVEARGLINPTVDDLDLTYRMALTVLFRLLFVAYAEDHDLLPYKMSEPYRNRSLKRKAQEIAEHFRSETPVTPGTSHWDEVTRIWNAIEHSDAELSVPAYDGGLFSSDRTVSRAGAGLKQIRLPNELFQPALRDLLLKDLEPVDFRSLGVREFGTIYEGLLESELSVAEQDLALDPKGSYVPATKKTVVVVQKGDVYLHDKSGARKSSGSYFTKSFAVEHLLDKALMPALTDHLVRLRRMGDADAAEAFFDFRVADIAMGSGHFLVAAIDRIEQAFSEYLAEPQAKGTDRVRAELLALREAAKKQLGDFAEQMEWEFEDGKLLRRLIARRCVYGTDINPLAVDLAKLSIWIHTFVPGLPLSVLDHNLVVGDALIGIGSIDEIRAPFEEAGTSLFPVDAENLLGQAAAPLRRLANLADATLVDVAKARDAMTETRTLVGDTSALCDIITAQRIDPSIQYQFADWARERQRVQRSPARHKAAEVLNGLSVFHFPVAFPEVFLRRRSGFDVIMGNPPWQEATVEDHAFWARYFPGLRGLRQTELEAERNKLRKQRPDLVEELEREVRAASRLRKALTSGAYPGMGTGDPDFYKAFAWRFWNLSASEGGRIGVVLPRSAFAAKGSELFRKGMFTEAALVDLTILLNNRQWVFDEVHPQYTISLTEITRGRPDGETIALRGPFADLKAFEAGHTSAGARFSAAEVLAWNDTASLPLLPTEESIEVFAQLRKAPRLDLNDGKSWRARPDAELHATAQKPLMDFSDKPRRGYWPVFKGESFDIWDSDRGAEHYYAWADPKPAQDWIHAKRLRAGRSSRDSAHGEFPPKFRQERRTLACFGSRIAFRDITNRTNQRTVIAALLPPKVFITNAAPYLLWPRGDQKDQAFLLGVLCSLPLDWYARRFVETHVNYFVFNPLPIPRPPRTDRRWSRAVALAGRLAAPDDRFADWAEALGTAHGPLDPGEKQDMICELDAVVARLYGLSVPQLTHIFETFHEGWEYEERLQTVLEHFGRWRD